MESTKSGLATPASGKDGSEPGDRQRPIRDYSEPVKEIGTCALGPLHTARHYARPPSPKVAQTKIGTIVIVVSAVDPGAEAADCGLEDLGA